MRESISPFKYINENEEATWWCYFQSISVNVNLVIWQWQWSGDALITECIGVYDSIASAQAGLQEMREDMQAVDPDMFARFKTFRINEMPINTNLLLEGAFNTGITRYEVNNDQTGRYWY